MAAFALAIGTAHADRPPLHLKLHRAETGWQVAIDGNSFFYLTTEGACVELNSQGYVQLRYRTLKGGLPDVPPTVLPIRILPTQDGWSINFFGLQLEAPEEPRIPLAGDYRSWALVTEKKRNRGEIEMDKSDEIRITLDWDLLLPTAADQMGAFNETIKSNDRAGSVRAGHRECWL